MNNEERRQPQVFGYIRISDPTQKINRQADFMKELAIDEKNIFIDSGFGHVVLDRMQRGCMLA